MEKVPVQGECMEFISYSCQMGCKYIRQAGV
jgi:hypothetical protein